MSLTFKRVTQISKRRCRSESKNHSAFLSGSSEPPDQVHIIVDEFPPLQKTVEAAGPPIWETHYAPRELYTSGFGEQSNNRNAWNGSENACFEEDRWNVYNERESRCLVRSKFCCQKNRNVYCPQMSMTPIYEKPLSSILEENSAPQNQSAIISSPFNNKLNQNFAHSALQFNFAPGAPTRSLSSSLVAPLATNKESEPLNIAQKTSDCEKTLEIETKLKSTSSMIPLTPMFHNSFASQSRMPTLQGLKETAEKDCNFELRPVKAKSIHTMNESARDFQRSFSTNSNLTDSTMSSLNQQTPGPKIPLLSNTTWFLQDNISNQFGFNSILNGVSPVFQQGNLYAECYDFPTVPSDAFHIIMPVGTPVLPKKKDFEHLFSPYRRETSARRRHHRVSMLVD